jgi:fluoride exporter
MLKIILVGIGGFCGSVFRYLLSGWVQKIPWLETFPWGTLTVNVVGCFLIGLFGGLAENRQLFSTEMRLLLFVGLFGGFTTFSTFGFETFSFMQDGQWLGSLVNIGLQVIFGLIAVWAGYISSRLI